ncbi:MAG: 3,4-dihydroxy-2-butanone-4-phosphate synthase [Saprospiraceae bacterium]|nr:3,4-dihydroxy-2-butanone-4-phosphate synthase [Candidatus Opimibacter skivensis]MBL0006489.1 3,4-dihydroxy-2-butanone-4-phosphate synthase [Candidatus Opimibacter skivensis]MBP8086172.1 3,4-dihydroxy-2-butanone-4-phosphate synthase [Saprospiraceae bacterium]
MIQTETDTMEMTSQLDSISSAIEDIRLGKVVIVVDDEDRENEGDFICAAQCVTPEIINFMATHGRGLICAPLNEKRVEELKLQMMVKDNTALHETAFTVSIDLIGHGCTTGISAQDRSTGIRSLVDPDIKAEDYARPGHIFPLKAKTGGVLRRSGHTEAAIDLARMAGFYPAGVLVEILNQDGTMARLPQLIEIAKKHDLKIISIQDLIAFRMDRERIVERMPSYQITSRFGDWEVVPFRQMITDDIHLALVKGHPGKQNSTLVRVHSMSRTGDMLGLIFGNTGTEIDKALSLIAEEGNGVFLLMRHSELSDNVLDVLKSFAGQDGASTSEQRDIGVGAQILRELGISKMKLMSNNTISRVGLIGFGLEIVENVKL